MHHGKIDRTGDDLSWSNFMPTRGTGNSLFCRYCGHDDLKFQTGFFVQGCLGGFGSFIMVCTIPVSAARQPTASPPIKNSNLLLADAAPWARRIVVTTLFAKRTARELN